MRKLCDGDVAIPRVPRGSSTAGDGPSVVLETPYFPFRDLSFHSTSTVKFISANNIGSHLLRADFISQRENPRPLAPMYVHKESFISISRNFRTGDGGLDGPGG